MFRWKKFFGSPIFFFSGSNPKNTPFLTLFWPFLGKKAEEIGIKKTRQNLNRSYFFSRRCFWVILSLKWTFWLKFFISVIFSKIMIFLANLVTAYFFEYFRKTWFFANFCNFWNGGLGDPKKNFFSEKSKKFKKKKLTQKSMKNRFLRDLGQKIFFRIF